MDIHYTKKIDYKQLFAHVMKSWKVLLVCGIIGAIVCGGATYALSGKSQNTYQSDLNSAKAELSSTEVTSTETAYKSQQDLDKQIKALRNRLDNSIYYNLDSNKAKNMVIVYNVSGSSEADSIIDAIDSTLIDASMLKQLSIAAHKAITMTDAKKLISVNRETSNGASNINVSLSNSNVRSQNFTINVIGEDQNQANAFTKIVKNRMQTIKASLTKSLGDFKLIQASTTTEAIDPADIADEKSGYADKLSSLSNAKLALTNTMNDAEKAYLDALSKDKTGVQAVPTSTKVINGIKGIVVGFILFAAIAFAWIGSRFILGKQMRNIAELQSINHMRIIDEVEGDLSQAKEELSFLAHRYPAETIGIVSTCHDAKIQVAIKQMMPDHFALLPAKPATDQDYKQLEKVQRVVVIEEMNVSLLNEIVDMVKYYVQKDISIEGAIVVK